MAKGYQKKNGVYQPEPARPGGQFTNSSGRSWPIHGLSPMLPDRIRVSLQDEWDAAGRALGDPPEPPTYETVNAAGETSRYPHNSTTLQSDDDRAAWDAYQAQLTDYRERQAQFNTEYDLRLMRAVCLCVDVHPEEEATWAEEQALIGVSVPENQTRRRLAFVETEVIRSADDIVRLMTAVFKEAGMADERMAAAAEAAFRAAVEQKRDGDTDRPAEDPTEG